MNLYRFSQFVFTACGLLLLNLTLVSCRHAPSSPPPAQTVGRKVTPSLQIAPDIKPEALWDARTFKPFVALDLPKMVRASQANFLSDREYILGIHANGESRAYPIRFMAFHHVVNDQVGASPKDKIPVAITFCSNCNLGIRYDPRLRNETLLFDFYGLYNGVATLRERRTQSVFLLAEGRFVTGALMGTRLKTGPLLDTTWGEWKKLRPDTLVMSQDTPFKESYGVAAREGQRHLTGSVYSFLGATVTRGDKRLPPFDLVLAVTLDSVGDKQKGGQKQTTLYRAYPVEAVEQAGNAVNDMLGSQPVCVLLDARTQTAVALSRRLGTRTLTLEARSLPGGETAFFDRETETRWNLEGQAEAGPLKGRALERLDSHLSQWYGWAASFPDTGIYGRSDPPQPDNPFVEGRKN